MSSTLRIGLLWHSLSSNNLGVGALSLSQIMLLERLSKELGLTLEYSMFGTEGSLEYGPPDLEGRISRYRFSPRNLIDPRLSICSKFRECALIIDIGEGDSFSDIYGAARFGKLALSKMMAHLCRVPLVLAPQTIGPFNNSAARSAATFLLKKAEHVFARDSTSLEYARELAPQARCSAACDLAFLLPYSFSDRPSPAADLHVGLNVSALLYHGGYSRNNQFALGFDYRDFAEKLIDRLCARPDTVLHLVPHVLQTRQPVEDDYEVCRELYSRFPGTRLAPAFGSPSEAKSYISALDFFVGSRMHATIAALSSGVPVVPVAYSRKFRSLFSDLGYDLTIDATETSSADSALSRTLEALDRRESIVVLAEKARQSAAGRLIAYESFLKTALEKLSEQVPQHS